MEKSGVVAALQKGPVKVLDNACGTGVISELVYQRLANRGAASDNLTLVATDLGPAMVEAVQAKISKNGWKNASAQVMDMQVELRARSYLSSQPKCWLMELNPSSDLPKLSRRT